MVKSISAIVGVFAKLNEKSELVIGKQLQLQAHGFIEMAISLVDRIENTITENDTLADIRKEYNECLLSVNLKGSNYGFSNVLKIGNIAKKNKPWLLGFKSLTALAVGLGAFSSVPSCKGIAALGIMAVKGTVDDQIKKIDNSLANEQIREIVNTAKNIPNKPKIDDPKAVKPVDSVKPVDTVFTESKAVDTVEEKSALAVAKIINSNRDNDAFLIAFCADCFNLGCLDKLAEQIEKTRKNVKSVNLKGTL